jgi:HEAT repeat protein
LLAILTGPRDRPLYAEFGDPIGLPDERKALLRWVLADYPRRRDEQWRCTPPEGTAILQELLHETAAEHTAAAVLAIGWYGLPESGPDVLQYIDHAVPAVRRAAVRALGQLGWFRAIPEVERKLDDTDAQVRREALIALGKYGRDDALARAIAAAPREADGAAIIQHATSRTRALLAEDTRAFVEVVLQSPEYEDLAVWTAFVPEELAQVPPDTRRDLEVRLRATRLLGLAQARQARQMLLALLAKPATPLALRIQCAVALGRLRVPRTAEALIPLLDVEDPELQLAVIAALGGAGSMRALMPLLDRWDAREKTLREPLRLAVRALGRAQVKDALLTGWTHPPEGEPLVAAAIEGDRWTSTEVPAWARSRLAHPEARARSDAIAVLALIGERSDNPALARIAAQDPDEEIRWLAALAARALARGDVIP